MREHVDKYHSDDMLSHIIMVIIAWTGKGSVDTYGVKSPRPYPVTSRQIMSQALAGENGPGESWQYDAVGTRWINHLPDVILNATGRKASEIFQTEFHVPLGLSDEFKWRDADNVFAAGT